MPQADHSHHEAVVVSDRSRASRILRWTVLIGVPAVLALGGVGIAAATTAPSPPSPPGPAVRHVGGGGGPFGGPGGGGFGTGFAAPGAFGAAIGGPASGDSPGGGHKVATISGTMITVTGPGSKSTTYQITSSTTYSVDGIPAPASAVHVGDHVIVRAPFDSGRFKGPNASTTTTTAGPTQAVSVNVVLPSLIGTVHSVGHGQFVLVDSQGFWRTVNTSGSTSYLQSGTSASASVVVAGAQVEAAGTVDSDHTSLDASTVNVILPSVAGQVSAIAGTNIIVSGFDGSTTTVTTSGATHFTAGGKPGSIGDVKVGDVLTASGTKSSNGDLAAVTVTVSPAGKGGHGGFPGPFARPGAPAGPAGPGAPSGSTT